ncbi:MAG TPA: hydroxyacid dehydrogenase [Candidatus Sulfotelmatobacter sp.]|nr:hydroxyacid dehydrogenase [Candidatus Sulfotelmatobacter sp.]
MKVLVSDRLEPSALAKLRAAGHDVVERLGVQGTELIAALEGCSALLIRGGTRVTGEVLRGARGLEVVARAGSGLDNVDVAEARRLGIAVVNAPAANSVSVAELVFGLLLAFERHLVPASAGLKQGKWERSAFVGAELAGRRLGLVGFGAIGRAMARRARAFEMEVSAFDPLLSNWPAEFEWVSRASLDSLLAGSDVVSLHVPLLPETRGLIGASQLARMRRSALLVNAARGGLVDEPALADALRAGGIRGAILDVFESEPPGSNPLLGLSNVLATPHLGASTEDAQRRAGAEVVERVIELLSRAGS